MITIFMIIGITVLAGIIGFFAYGFVEKESAIYPIGLLISSTLTVAVICAGMVSYANKSLDSKNNISNGAEMTVTIYDASGKEISEYSGEFDVEYNGECIKFDYEDGKINIICHTEGTVIIEEK